MLQPAAALRISDVEIPADAAADDEAPLTECALKIDISTPEASSKDFSHLVTVLEDTALCGLITATYKQLSFPSLKGFCSVLIFLGGHWAQSILSWKRGEEIINL